MDKYKRLVSNTMLFAISTFSSKLLSFVMAPLFSYWFETQEMNGIKELLNQHFPEDFLDIIIGGEDVQTPKPSPEGLLLAIRQLHATKAETLYIGDSTVDAETAQKAGVDFAGITHGMTTAEELKKYPHKKIMSSLEELLEREPLPAAASPKNISVRRIALLLLLFAAFAALFCFLILI